MKTETQANPSHANVARLIDDSPIAMLATVEADRGQRACLPVPGGGSHTGLSSDASATGGRS